MIIDKGYQYKVRVGQVYTFVENANANADDSLLIVDDAFDSGRSINPLI